MVYLTVDEYVKRYGQQETAMITNEAKALPGAAPVMVASKVEEAIVDATDIVNGYIGTRYALPLPSVPGIVKGWVARLAREYLFRSRPLDAVTEDAKRARLQLVDLSTRKLNLEVPEGSTEPTTTGGGTAQVAGDRLEPTFSPDRMNSFMGGFGRPSRRAACWRSGGG